MPRPRLTCDGVRLVILDEPFRGSTANSAVSFNARADSEERRTLLCITHDVAETRAFPRVLVIEGGRMVEDGAPSALESQEGSLYRAMLDADRAIHERFYSDPSWRHIRLENGTIDESRQPVEGVTWAAR